MVSLKEREEWTRLEVNSKENVRECSLGKNRRITRQYWNTFVVINHKVIVVWTFKGALFSQ